MRTVLRIAGIVLLVVLVILVIGVIYVYAQSNTMINKTYDIDVMDFEVPETTDELLEEGRRIFVSRGCGDCHGSDATGTVMLNNMAFGAIVSPNITGGDGYQYSNEDFIRAVLHGVKPDGRAIQLMPSLDYTEWREEDLGALLVYLTNIEPVEDANPEMSFGPLYRALMVFNVIPVSAEVIDHDAAGLVEIEANASAEYGEYLAHTTCVGCHGSDFSGGTVPGSSLVAANLTFHEDGLAGWSLEDFQTAIQTGIRPDGSQLDPGMPVVAFAAFTDVEVEAIYTFLQSLEPVASN